ncbi:DEAD/DEAH box helicase [Butyrivibrio proteoclasticus]|uniref:DEAD/DEAH box helicase n=1 Tax=Butyrivibrio proteoclasticus TaxID=43305 RepID=UPI00047CF0C1|nr:DEAD/DEAH box helicase [Butyrivibrio proteoclasticus]
MKYVPHKYQEQCMDFILSHPEAMVWLSCGLGKTSIGLTCLEALLFDYFVISKVLVICPIRVAYTWRDEIEQWDHIKHLRYVIATGTEKQRIKALTSDADIYIINRENVDWLVNKSGVPFIWNACVVDEVSSFKNSQSKRFKALMKCRPKFRRIIALTGTPSSNGLEDLYAEFKIMDYGVRLGRFIGQFRTTFFRPAVTNGAIVYKYAPLPGAADEIYKRISDITISMKATDYLDMPELIESNYNVSLSEEETERYEALKKDLVIELPEGEVTASNAAALAGKLTQLANGAIYSDDGVIIRIHDAKLDAMEDIIESLQGESMLLAYWYKHDLVRITERLDKIGANYQKIGTDQSIKDWNAGKIQVGLIHSASCGHGINLQKGGSHIVFFGQIWSLELYQQTIARLWRQGQKSRTVVVQHIVTKGTVDERILKALSEKDMTQSALIAAVKAEFRGGEK